MEKKEVRPFGIRDKMGYLFGDFGNDFTFILSSSFLLKFYTDIMGVNAAIVGLVMMIARFVDAFTDVAKMKKIKEEVKAHEGQLVELTLENGRKREKNKIGRLTEVYPSLFIVEYNENSDVPGAINNSYVESYTYSDILTEKTLIHYFD